MQKCEIPPHSKPSDFSIQSDFILWFLIRIGFLSRSELHIGIGIEKEIAFYKVVFEVIH